MRAPRRPHVPFEVFDDPLAAHRFLDSNPWEGRLVVKADGLTRGKGVIVPDSLAAPTLPSPPSWSSRPAGPAAAGW